jgi:hypothetical protein
VAIHTCSSVNQIAFIHTTELSHIGMKLKLITNLDSANHFLQNFDVTSTSSSTIQPPQAPDSIGTLPEGFLHESVPIIVDLEANYQFGEDDIQGSNLVEIADQLPATTFWAFVYEFFSKLPDLILR